MARKLPPVHPGEVLREEFLVPLKLTPYAVAAALNVPRTRIERIAREEKPITADTALRLGKFFKTGAAFWMNIQARHDLEKTEDVLGPQIKKITPYEAAGRQRLVHLTTGARIKLYVDESLDASGRRASQVHRYLARTVFDRGCSPP